MSLCVCMIYRHGAYKSGKPGNLGEFCKSGKLREFEMYSGNFWSPLLSVTKCRPMTLVSENIRFMQIFARVPLGGGVKRHSTLCKKYARMTATDLR